MLVTTQSLHHFTYMSDPSILHHIVSLPEVLNTLQLRDTTVLFKFSQFSWMIYQST